MSPRTRTMAAALALLLLAACGGTPGARRRLLPGEGLRCTAPGADFEIRNEGPGDLLVQALRVDGTPLWPAELLRSGTWSRGDEELHHVVVRNVSLEPATVRCGADGARHGLALWRPLPPDRPAPEDVR